ncbi:MAG: pitrilysin family protein, partial [Bacteroidota bacterium]
MKKWLLLLCLLPNFLAAQPDLSQSLPFDPNVRTGELSNGIKYFIRKNAKPEKRAELRLAINAGAMQEDDDQQGLAHFVEHMCFNGTKAFPKSALVDYLESIGTRFGAHLNAYTSFDETVYMLQAPTDNREQFEKGFQVLQEWATNVSFDEAEIDKERGVVASERRNGLGADKRMFDKVFPVVMQGSRYAERLPIGQLEVLEKAPYERLRQFYKDWYRPDLMAVIAVGDFDVDDVEKLIKSRFGSIPPSGAGGVAVRKRETYEVPNHRQQLVAIATDPEASRIGMSLMYKHEFSQVKDQAGYRKALVTYLVNTMINNRLDEIRQQADAPFSSGFAFYGQQVRTKSRFVMQLSVTEKNVWRGMEAMFTETERLRRHGFQPGELERAKKEMMKNVESQFLEKDKTESIIHTFGLIDHFLEGSPFTSIDFDFEFYKKHLDGVTLDETNQRMKSWITEGANSVITYQGIEKSGIPVPTEAEIRKLAADVKAREITPYEDLVVTK